MNVFKSLGDDLSYKDVLEVDGAFSICHINYDKSPIFNKVGGKNIAIESRKNSLSNNECIDDVINNLISFNGTEKNCNKKDKIELWKSYWLEYVNTFDKLTGLLPDSVVTIYVGRQAIELGFKYLLLKKDGQIVKEHDLQILSELFYSKYTITDSYMNYIDTFCKFFCKYIEGGNVEYFRFPEYKENNFFAGNRLDIKWIFHNFALIILKLLHFANLDNEF